MACSKSGKDRLMLLMPGEWRSLKKQSFVVSAGARSCGLSGMEKTSTPAEPGMLAMGGGGDGWLQVPTSPWPSARWSRTRNGCWATRTRGLRLPRLLPARMRQLRCA